MTGGSWRENDRSGTGRRPGADPSRAGHARPDWSPGGRDRSGRDRSGSGPADYDAPDYDAPGYGASGYDAPGRGGPRRGTRGYDAPDYDRDADEPAGYGAGGYDLADDDLADDELDDEDPEPADRGRRRPDRFRSSHSAGGRSGAARSGASRAESRRSRSGRSRPARSGSGSGSGSRSPRPGRSGSGRQRAVQFSAARLRANRLILAVLVLGALGAVYGFATITPEITVGSAVATTQTGSLPVTSALLGCPAPGTATPTGGGLALASSGGNGTSSATGSGQAMLTQLSPGGGTGAGSGTGTTVHVLTQPGQLIVSRIPEAARLPKNLSAVQPMAGNQVPTSQVSGGLVVQAVGALAQGLDAEQLSPGGLPTARCQPPGSDFWFLGPGASGKPHIELYLLNTDSQAADASVSVQTDAGPWVGPSDSGITVPPYSMVRQDLTKLLQTAHAVSLNVTTSSGRVVAAVRETTDTTSGGAWLAPAPVPSVSQILPGLPGTPGTPELFISVPGNMPAQVQVSAITRRGTYQPTGGGGISVLSHTTTGIQLPSLAGLAAALKVTSNVPVAVSVMLPGGPSGAPGAFIAGSGPITQQSVVAASPAGSAGGSQLVLSAPQGAAKVSVVQAIPGEPLSSQTAQTVRIAANSTSTLVFSLKKGQSSATAIVILVTPLPGSGPVYAARVSQVSGSLDSILPLISTPTSVPLPAVRQSLTEILK